MDRVNFTDYILKQNVLEGNKQFRTRVRHVNIETSLNVFIRKTTIDRPDGRISIQL